MYELQYSKMTAFYLVIINLLFVTLASNALGAEQLNINDSLPQIIDTYDNNDLSSKPPFQGGYINFGYWKNILRDDSQVLTKENRVNSSFALYKLILDHLNIKENDRILEAGCGLGYGCKYVAGNYNLTELTCIDISRQNR
jgi:hypothetical protein